jgi:hypothetical protein
MDGRGGLTAGESCVLFVFFFVIPAIPGPNEKVWFGNGRKKGGFEYSVKSSIRTMQNGWIGND